jgi:hypothetical protein
VALDKFKLEPSTDVDSELFTAYIDKEGPFKLDEFFKRPTGSAAIAFIHKARMFVSRNNNPIEYELRPSQQAWEITVFAFNGLDAHGSLHHTWLCLRPSRFQVRPGEYPPRSHGEGPHATRCLRHLRLQRPPRQPQPLQRGRLAQRPVEAQPRTTLPKSLNERIEDLEKGVKDLKNQIKQERRSSRKTT